MSFPLATDWATISSLATAGGTLVLALATFAAVRSSNHSARIAEAALQEQRRPVFAPSRFDDPVQKIMFVEQKWVRAQGGHGVAEHENGNVYLAISLRNVGAGIGVCQAWAVLPGLQTSQTSPRPQPEEEFHTQTRDLYIPPGDVGMWQGALRDPSDRVHAQLVRAIEEGDTISVELLYSDQVGGQRTVTRFGLTPFTNPETGERSWVASVSRHWNLDGPGPRPETAAEEAGQAILRQVEARRAATEDGSANGGEPAPVVREQRES